MNQLLNNKRIVLGITGSISAYKAATLASRLTQLGALVDVILTRNAEKLVGAATFEGLTHRRCHVDTFADPADLSSSHVTLGSQADLVIVAPCSANMLAKIAHGIADDKLSTTMLAVRCPILIAPAMNVFMYENAATQANIELLKSRGMNVLEPGTGNLACGYSAKGRMPEPEDILELALQYLAIDKCLAGKRVLVTAGATREAIDDVRCITNPSTGKMGYACARAALMAGADVTIISANCALPPVIGAQMVSVSSAAQMKDDVCSHAPNADIVIMAAAVSDFTPVSPKSGKIHKTDAELTIALKPTEDILQTLGQNKRQGQFLCGFCMETSDLIERAKLKLTAKNLDMIVANDLTVPGCGFACDTNGVTILTSDSTTEYEIADKLDIAITIIQTIGRMISV